MRTSLIFSSLGLFFTPAIALAQESETTPHAFHIIPEQIDAPLAVVLLILSLVTAFYGIRVAALMQGGAFEKVWNKLALATIAFAIFQASITIEELGWHDAGSVHELMGPVVGILLFWSFYQAYRILKKQVLGK